MSRTTKNFLAQIPAESTEAARFRVEVAWMGLCEMDVFASLDARVEAASYFEACQIRRDEAERRDAA